MKQLIIRVLRSVRLINQVDLIRFQLLRMLNHQKRVQFERQNPGIPLPPDNIIYETYGRFDYQRYYFNGRETASDLLSLFSQHIDTKKSICICEWGCGSGRILRHLKDMLDGNTELVGTDLDAGMINWNKQNLEGIRFLENRLLPPIDIGDNYFDLVYSVSVMTHLSSENQKLWLDECMRILKPGGCFFFSVHGDSFVDYLSDKEKQTYYDSGFVFRGNCGEGSKNQVSYTSPDYIQNTLLKKYDDISHIPGNYREQDFWIVKK